MNFTVSSTALSNRLSAAAKVQASKNMIPILDCFLFEVKDGVLTITASDSEKYVVTSMPLVSSTGDARFCVLSKTIMEPVKELPEQPVTFEFNTDTYSLKGTHSSGTFGIVAQDAASYPSPVPMSENYQTLEIPSSILANGMSRCLFATANEEIRMVMTGVYLDVKPEEIIFAGTDGRRLVRNVFNKVNSGLTCGFIIPKKVANMLKSLLPKDDHVVRMDFDNDKACIKDENFTLRFSFIEGRYPNYNGVIPPSSPYEVLVDRQAFASAVKRVSAFSNQSSCLVKLELTPGNLRITGQDFDHSTNAEEYLTCDYTETPISIGFSGQYLIEIANMLESQQIKLQLGDPGRPGVIRPVNDNTDEDLLMLIMPMRVEETGGM